MAREAQFAMVATQMAIEQSKLAVRDLKKQQPIPIAIGVTSNAMDIAAKAPASSTLVCGLPNGVSTCIGEMYDIQTKHMTLSNACTSALDAIAYGSDLVKSGAHDVVIAGGAGSPLTRYAIESLLKCKRCSTRNDDPKHASRPFDRDHDQGVIAEGAGIVILENWSFAQARGKRPYAEVLGHGCCIDPNKKKEGSGIEQAMRESMANSGLRETDIDCIFAHGPSDRDMDIAETLAIKNAMGDHAYTIPVTSIKGVTGCASSASGGHQVIAATLALEEQLVPPTANLENADTDCDLDCVPGRSRRARLRHVMINAHGIGRGNSTLTLKRTD